MNREPLDSPEIVLIPQVSARVVIFEQFLFAHRFNIGGASGQTTITGSVLSDHHLHFLFISRPRAAIVAAGTFLEGLCHQPFKSERF